MEEALLEVAARAKSGGTLWFIFIGHGAPSQDANDGVLVGWDAQQTAKSLYLRSVKHSQVLAALRTGKQSRTVAVLDACFSGRTTAGSALVAGLQPAIAIAAPRKHRDALILTAAKGNEFAGPLPGANRPAFSYLALGALHGWADADRDGKVTGRELVEYTEDALQSVINDRSQTPQLLGEDAVVARPLAKADLTSPSSSFDARSRPLPAATAAGSGSAITNRSRYPQPLTPAAAATGKAMTRRIIRREPQRQRRGSINRERLHGRSRAAGQLSVLDNERVGDRWSARFRRWTLSAPTLRCHARQVRGGLP